MSALGATTDLLLPGKKSRSASGRPRLRVVPKPAPRMARVPFLGILIATFGLGMAGLLMLNTTLQNQTFETSRLKRQVTELTYAEADLQGQLTQLNAPQELARRASAAGLRPNPHPAQLQLPSGKVTGKPTPVTGNEAPLLVVKTPAELAKERAASAAKKAAAEAKQRAEALQKAAAARQQQLQAEQAARVKLAQQQAAQKQAAQQQAAQQKQQTAKPKGGR